MQLRSDIVSLVVVGVSFALIGWGMVVFSSQIERGRQERHNERFGEHR